MAVPADAPLGGVMSSIVEAIEETPSGSPGDAEHWRLTLDDGRLLNPRATLIESGVHEAAQLYLRHFEPEETAPEPLPQVPVHPLMPQPLPIGQRLRATAGALVTGDSGEDEEAPL